MNTRAHVSLLGPGKHSQADLPRYGTATCGFTAWPGRQKGARRAHWGPGARRASSVRRGFPPASSSSRGWGLSSSLRDAPTAYLPSRCVISPVGDPPRSGHRDVVRWNRQEARLPGWRAGVFAALQGNVNHVCGPRHKSRLGRPSRPSRGQPGLPLRAGETRVRTSQPRLHSHVGDTGPSPPASRPRTWPPGAVEAAEAGVLSVSSQHDRRKRFLL